jgi:hypothetical protein
MMAPATNPNLLPHTVDTIVGGISTPSSENPWAKKSSLEPEEPTRKSFSDPEQLWLRIVLQEIKAVAALAENWDGYGSGPIRRDVLWYALRLLQSVMEDCPAPQLTPMSHEGILLEWHRGGILLEIEIEDAGEAYVIYENKESGADHAWQVSTDFTSLSEPLRAIAAKHSASSTTTTS